MRTLFVTGASSGLGFAIAERFLAEGWRAVVCARRFDRLQDLSRRFSDRAFAIELDVTDHAAVVRTVQALPKDFASIDVLVNNAGLALGLAPAQAASLDDWDRMIATDCSGLVHVTRAILPGMVARNSGSIINIGSIAGETPYPGGNVYGATKAFVHQFTQNLNADLIGSGVRATCVEPGLCGGTEFSNVRFAGDDERAKAVYAGTTPLTAEDIADTVHWIATRPAHVTINVISMMPNCQSFGPLAIKRTIA
jgi:NADP-dependent 3-hydroxy acid dehydrogenase YdfG